MKFNLKKKNLKQLNRNVNDLEKQQTPQVAGGQPPTGISCYNMNRDGHNSCFCKCSVLPSGWLKAHENKANQEFNRPWFVTVKLCDWVLN